MAITYSYPTALPEIQDLLVGTEISIQGGEDAPRTRTFTIGSISDLISIPLVNSINLKANIASPIFTGVVRSPSFVKLGGSSNEFLMADGSVSTNQGNQNLQQVVNIGNTIVLPSNKNRGIDITVADLQNQYSSGIRVTLNSQTGTYSNNDAFVAVMNGQNPNTLPNYVGGFYASVTGGDNYSFVSEHSTGTVSSSHYTAFNAIGITSNFAAFKANNVDVFKVDYLGNVTANKFAKQGGSPTQYLMANGDTTTMPTLAQVVTAGSTSLNPISVTSNSFAGATVNGTSNIGVGIYGGSNSGIGVSGYAEDGIGAEFETDSVSANIANFKNLNVLKASVGNNGDITANSFIKAGGSPTEYLMADGNTSTGGGYTIPTLQEVTNVGNNTTKNIVVNNTVGLAGVSVSSGTAVGIYGLSDGTGVWGYSTSGKGIYGYAESVTGIGVSAYSEDGVAAEFETDANTANIVNFKKAGILKASISNEGNITAALFKTPTGSPTQYLMANGSTSTVPTLAQVVTAGAVSLDPISITISNAFTGASVYGASNVGVGIYGLSQSGIGVKASSDETIAGKFTTESSTANIVEFYKSNVLKASIGNNGNITANSFVKSGGAPTQYLMADGNTTGAPTLQTVTTAGNTTNKTIIANVAGGLVGVYGSSGTGKGIYGSSELGIGVSGTVTNGIAIEGYTESATSIAIRGYGEEGLGGEFETDGVGNIVNFKTSGVLKASVGNGGDITANSFIKTGSSPTQYLMADGNTTGPLTLQTVTTNGNTTNKTITANVTGGLTALFATTTSGRAIYGSSNSGKGIEGVSVTDTGVYGNTLSGRAIEGYAELGIGVRGYSEDNLGGEFETDGVGNIVEFKTGGVLKASVGNGGVITAASFKTPTGTSSQYLMADGSVNANTVTNLTTIALTLTALNAAYPSVIIGFTVQCPDATVLKSYQKTASGWISYTIANVV